MEEELHCVELPKDMQILVPRFLARRREEAQELKAAIESGDVQAVRDVGQRMSGLGFAYGFPRITELGTDIVHAVQKRDLRSLALYPWLYSAYLNAVRVIYY